MKKKILIGLFILLGVGATFYLGTKIGEYKYDNDKKIGIEDTSPELSGEGEKENDSDEEQASGNLAEGKDNGKNNGDEGTKVESVKLKEGDAFKFEKVKAEYEELSFGTPWKSSPSGKNQVAIEGRGEEAIEEGVGSIFIKVKGQDTVVLNINGKSMALAPTYVEWVDDESFLVVMASAYGRMFTGTKLYMVNINDLKPYIVYEAGENEEILEASKISTDTINIKVQKYEGDKSVPMEKEIKIK